MLIGYARVSDKGQNPDRQIEKFKLLGIDERFIFVEKQSGKTFERPVFKAMKQVLREGDILYLDALNRLGRDYDGIIREWKNITQDIQADIVVLDHENIFDSRKFKQMGKLGKLMEDQFLSILSYLADQTREDIKRMQMEGIRLALAQKRPYGRPRVPITEKLRQTYLQWKDGQITAKEAMRINNLKSSTFYRLVKKLNEEYKNIEEGEDNGQSD